MTATEAQKKELLSKRQVASLLDISTRTVSRMTKKGILKSYLLNGTMRYYKYSEIMATIETGAES